jgi:hypothetical protein
MKGIKIKKKEKNLNKKSEIRKIKKKGMGGKVKIK